MTNLESATVNTGYAVYIYYIAHPLNIATKDSLHYLLDYERYNEPG